MSKLFADLSNLKMQNNLPLTSDMIFSDCEQFPSLSNSLSDKSICKLSAG